MAATAGTAARAAKAVTVAKAPASAATAARAATAAQAVKAARAAAGGRAEADADAHARRGRRWYPPPVSELATHWLKAVPALKETGLRVGLVGSEIEDTPLDVVAEALEHISMLAEQADPRAREVLSAALPILTDPAKGELVGSLREQAQEGGHFALARLLRRRGGIRDGLHDVPEPGERHPGEARVGRAVTLGERKSLARGRNRDVLDRLLRDPHPQVIRTILVNPRITEEDVVRLAARRPTYPDVQAELAKSPRWGIRQRVRVALVQNPYTPPAISVPILSMLVRQELEQVLQATDVPPIVRGAALELLERRPPIPAREDEPETKQ
jgi:hypothetical protein